MFKPYFVNKCLPSYLLASAARDCRCQSDGSECADEGERGGKTNDCKCTHCILCLIFMCNVVALTFYAIIYKDICRMCNKSR